VFVVHCYVKAFLYAKQFSVWYHFIYSQRRAWWPVESRYYRGITLTLAISRLFESVLLAKYGNVLHSYCLQYGFKKDSSCSHALFNFMESVRFYNKWGSKVYCAFLGARKAFDKVLISGLIAELIKWQAPLTVILILVSWNGSLQCSVVWNSLVSALFEVRQGGVLSPFLFAVYVNDLIVELRRSGLGLYTGSTFTGANADDNALTACSCLHLQKLISICMAFGLQ